MPANFRLPHASSDFPEPANQAVMNDGITRMAALLRFRFTEAVISAHPFFSGFYAKWGFRLMSFRSLAKPIFAG